MKWTTLFILSLFSILSFAEVSESPATIIEWRTEYHLREKDNFIIKESRNVEINNKAGEIYQRLYFTEDPYREMKKFNVRVYDSTGKLVEEYSRKDFKERLKFEGSHIYDDIKEYYLEVGLPHYPFRVEYDSEFEREYLFDITWMPKAISGTKGVDISLIIENEGDLPMDINFDDSVIEYKMTESDQGSRHAFVLTSADFGNDEPFAPTKMKEKVFVVLEEFEFDGYAGSLKTWEDFGLWMLNLWEERTELSDKSIRNWLPRDVLNAGTKEKVNFVYDYIQSNMRYVSVAYGLGGLQTMEAEETYKLGYGDCKALTNFMCAALKKMGVESFPALVYAGEEKAFIDPRRPSNAFNHVILCIPTENDTLWAECTSNRLPLNYLSDFTDDRYVMLMTPTGGKLTRTPAYSSEENRAERSISVDLSPTGSAEIKMEGVYHKLAIDKSLFMFRELTNVSREKLIAAATTFNSFDVRQADVQLYPGAEPLMKVNVDIAERLFGKRMNTKLLLSPFRFKLSLPQFEKEERGEAIEFARGYTFVDTVRINIPKGMNLQQSFPNQSRTEKFGSFDLSLEMSGNGNQLLATRKIIYHEGIYEANEYNAIKSFFDEANSSSSAYIILQSEK